MGTWNSAIFGDDTACDVRDQFTELLSTGVSADEATKALLASSAAVLQDADDGPIFWVALAATQWKYGCLLPEVQAEAIQIIDSNAGLSRWEGRAAGARRRALRALRAQLLSPQPSARRPRPRKPVIVLSTEVLSPDSQARAIAYQITGPPHPRMQVCVEIDSSWGPGRGASSSSLPTAPLTSYLLTGRIPAHLKLHIQRQLEYLIEASRCSSVAERSGYSIDPKTSRNVSIPWCFTEASQHWLWAQSQGKWSFWVRSEMGRTFSPMGQRRNVG
jgi:hypothetical protein